MRVFVVVVRAVFFPAALMFFCAFFSSAGTAADLGPRPEVVVLSSPQHLPRVAEQDVFAPAESDPGKRILRLREAAGRGDAQSARKLGMLYFSGREVESNGAIAYAWLYLARRGFSRPAVQERDEDPESYTSPLKFLAWTMTLQEEREAAAILAAWPKTLPPETLRRDPETRMERYRVREPVTLSPPLSPREIAALHARAGAGDTAAEVRLGFLYQTGRGVRGDAARAFSLFKAAADAGELKGLRALAQAYANGVGVETSLKKAGEIYADLANKGDAEDQVSLGEILLRDRYYEDARQSEDEEAADHASALEWFSKAAAQGSSKAMFALGRICEEKKEYDQAAAWYERAAAAGSEEALGARIGIAEKRRNAAELYTWISIWMSWLPPDQRMGAREMMLQFAGNLTDEKVQQLKLDVDVWLKEHPGLQQAALKRAAEKAAYYQDRDAQGATALHRAVAADDAMEAERLLTAGADPNSMDDQGHTPLFASTAAKSRKAAQLLVAAGAVVDAQDFFGRTPLMEAVAAKNTEAARFFLDAGADARLRNTYGDTALIMAVERGNAAVVSLLLNAGADAGDTNAGGNTPLIMAAEQGNAAVASLLLAAGADAGAANARGRTPLFAVASTGKLEALPLLLAAGAKPDAQDKDGVTALCVAAQQSRPAVVKALLDARADPDLPCGKNAETALHAAAQKKDPEYIQLLLTAKARPDMADKSGKTPLHRAAGTGRMEAAQLLLAAGADPNVADKDGKSALDAASDPAVERILKQAGAKSGKAEAQNKKAGLESEKAGIDAVALYDELGRPMNRAAERASRDKPPVGGKSVNILLDSPDQAEAFNATVAQERAGQKSPYLTRAVLMDASVEELAERIKDGRDVNAVDPVFGRALSQALEQRRSSAMVKCLLDHGADPNAGKPLLTALSRRSDESVPLLLAAGADPGTVDRDNTPILILAVEKGNAAVVRALLKAGAPADTRDAKGRTALSHALQNRLPQDMVSLLLAEGASPTAFPALLALAWNRDNVRTALLLLEKGASGAVVRQEGGSLLHWAVQDDSPELLDAALKAGAPLNARDRDNDTALYMAVRKGKAAFVAALLKAGAPVNASALVPGTKFSDYRGVYAGEDDMLPRAVKKGNTEVVRELIAGGVALDARENTHDRPTALCKAVDEGLPDIVNMALAAGAKPDVADRYGRTPLHHAVKKKDRESLAALLAAKADPNLRDKDDETPLYLAAEKNLPDMAAALLAAGAKPDVTGKNETRVDTGLFGAKNGWTPLHLAASKDGAEIARMLLAAEADPNAATTTGETPLVTAVRRSGPELIDMLLGAGAKVNVHAGHRGDTPLHDAAVKGKAEIVRMLLAAGADPGVRNKEGKTPLDMAEHPDVVKALKER